MKTKSKRPSAPARRSRGQQRARSRLLHPRAGRRCTPRSRAPPMPRRRRRPFYSMGFARSAGALDIICAAGEASGSGVWRRLTRGRAQACVAWRRRAGAGREYRGAPGSARCLRSVPRQERLVSFSGKATIRCWVGRTHGPHACRTHVLRAPGADPGHPGGRVVGAIDQYVSTTSIIISRGPQLVRKAVLEQTLLGVEDVLWRT